MALGVLKVFPSTVLSPPQLTVSQPCFTHRGRLLSPPEAADAAAESVSKTPPSQLRLQSFGPESHVMTYSVRQLPCPQVSIMVFWIYHLLSCQRPSGHSSELQLQHCEHPPPFNVPTCLHRGAETFMINVQDH